MDDDFEYIAESPPPLMCPRCDTEMRFGGTKKFHEGSFDWGFWLGDLGEMVIHRESIDVYVCPECGKVEFFLEGIGTERRPTKPGGPVV